MKIAPMPSLLLVEEEKLPDKAYKEIEELIVTLQLQPGQVVSETGLAKLLSIGRTPVREALQQLAREGLIQILPRRGIIVSEINVRNQIDLLMVRREIERLMARLAASRATQNELSEFHDVASAMRASALKSDDIAFMRQDRELNRLLCLGCRNDYVRRSMALMQGLSRRFWYLHYRDALDLSLCANLHAELGAAVASQNADAAGTASDRLFTYLEDVTRALNDRYT